MPDFDDEPKPDDELERVLSLAGIIAQAHGHWRIGPAHLLAGCTGIAPVREYLRSRGLDDWDFKRIIRVEVLDKMPPDETLPPGHTLGREGLAIVSRATSQAGSVALNVLHAVADDVTDGTGAWLRIKLKLTQRIAA